AAGVLSALGLAIADRRREYVHSSLQPLSGLEAHQIREALRPLLDAAHRDLPGAALLPSADLRYRGQSHELTIPLPADFYPGAIAGRFDEAYRARYRYGMLDADVELVNLRLTATIPGSRPALRESDSLAGGPG